MTAEEVLRNREKLFNELLEQYSESAKEDPRYKKTVKKLKSKKEEFLSGRTLVQVLRG